MNALILFAHGSAMCGSSETLLAHADRLRASGRWDWVEVAFLNYSQPNLREAVTSCISAGVDRVVVLPYFLTEGRFVTVDVPAHVAEAQRAFPHTPITIGKPIGAADPLVEAVLASAETAVLPAEWNREVERLRVACSNRADCPLRVAGRCPVGGGGVA